mgnify:CR=1 FL=1
MRLNEFLGIKYPIIQGGMANIALGEFAAAVSNAGGLGLIASGGFDAERIREEIKKCRALTDKPFGVNLMLMNPDVEFLLYAVLPIKVKWLALLDAVYMVYQIINSLYLGFRTLAQGASAIYTTTAGAYFSIAIAIIVAMANFLIYFFATRQSPRARMQQKRRKRSFERQTNQYANGARHRCAVCGRTELDDDSLDFRYCSKCDGNYEYCSDHLFTHQHVKKFM